MAWALWLAVPITVTVLVALWVWWFARPDRTPKTAEAMRQHQQYLDALVVPARGSARPPEH